MLVRPVVLALILGASLSAEAVTRYVDPACTNGITTYNPTASAGSRCTGGTSLGYSTIPNAISPLVAGDVIRIRAGTYNQVINLTGKTGTAVNPITITAYSGETVTISPNSTAVLGMVGTPGTPHGSGTSGASYVTFGSLIFDGVNVTNQGIGPFTIQNGPRDITIDGCTIKNWTYNGIIFSSTNITIRNTTIKDQWTNLAAGGERWYGIYVGNTSVNVIIEGNTITNNPGGGIHASPGPISGIIIRNNTIASNGYIGGAVGGFTVSGGSALITGAQIYNNVVYGNGVGHPTSGQSRGFTIENRVEGAKVWNNTVYGNNGIGIAVLIGACSGCTPNNTVIQNNISFGNTLTNIHNDGTNTTSTNNLVVNPSFVNPSAGDFHLQPTGSAAMDTGVNLTACGFTTDRDGSARPTGGGTCTAPTGAAWEVGAYEVGGTGPDTTPPGIPPDIRVSKLEAPWPR